MSKVLHEGSGQRGRGPKNNAVIHSSQFEPFHSLLWTTTPI